MRLIQLYHPEQGRRIAKVEEPYLNLLSDQYTCAYNLFRDLVENESSPADIIPGLLTGETLNYDPIYSRDSEWNILPALDCPDQPLMCMLSGTGLTHKASAENRQHMHEKLSSNDDLTDSMKMYLLGEEGGKPASGSIGIQPEWFYKGNGSVLKGFGDYLDVPSYADDGGEEPEVAGIYLIDLNGTPCRIGFAIANEFSDHIMEKKNYLYLAPSKLRTCAIGPELVLDHNFTDLQGKVSITRKDQEIWSKEIRSGEKNMSHTLANLEYHHFKYKQHRIPGMVHIHFFGADAFSFGEDIRLSHGDWMTVAFDGLGRPLRNLLRINSEQEKPITIKTFDQH